MAENGNKNIKDTIIYILLSLLMFTVGFAVSETAAVGDLKSEVKVQAAQIKSGQDADAFLTSVDNRISGRVDKVIEQNTVIVSQNNALYERFLGGKRQ
jgi:hypothetical protein